MARAYTKCAGCGDLLWFSSTSVPPQSVVCPCGGTQLTEDGPAGGGVEPSAEEVEFIEAQEEGS